MERVRGSGLGTGSESRGEWGESGVGRPPFTAAGGSHPHRRSVVSTIEYVFQTTSSPLSCRLEACERSGCLLPSGTHH